jgi:hypothetical protein|tara:strand:- start:57 stop:398 length:342 start_codon:yes stop_codon:yes gene_type:complete
MEKFLLFVDAENDIAMYPVSKLAAVTCAADEAVLLRFSSGVAGGTGAGGTENDLVTLTTTAGANVEKAIFQEIARATNATGPQYSDGVITVCDDVNSVFLHKDILSCAITLDT